ncbi:hypothetical protein BGX21_005857 [Mortierella sp. AD011]|nr:hypothetical protein BGX20_007381 [Mortierella sp. AD010]KAF9403256.1 hypothetical protein BGX21_005857 [Mortierella sp. AD011]
MAILDFDKDNDKSISIHFHSPELGPDSQPLYYSTPESPAIVTGHVEFRSVKPTNGSDITLTFEARSECKWTEQHGKSSVHFHYIVPLQEKSWDIKLNRSNPKTISPGVVRYDFSVQLDPELPPSIEGRRGWFHYRFKALICRDFPRRNMAVKQLIWVYSSSIRVNEQPQPKIYRQVFNDMMPFSCTLPSDVLYQDQIVPLTVQFDPFRDSSILRGQQLIVMSAIVKLKQYTTLCDKKFLGKTRKEKKVVFILPVSVEDWPHTEQGFTKTIMVDLPDARKLAASIETVPLTKTHCLKLIMMVRTSATTEKEAKEIRMEMDVKITSPRPEHIKDMTYNRMTPNAIAPPPYFAIDNDEDDGALSQLSHRSSTSSHMEGSMGTHQSLSYPADVKNPLGL